MFTHLTDPEHWRSRAEEMRTLGERSRDTGVKRTLLKIAVDSTRWPSVRRNVRPKLGGRAMAPQASARVNDSADQPPPPGARTLSRQGVEPIGQAPNRLDRLLGPRPFGRQVSG